MITIKITESELAIINLSLESRKLIIEELLHEVERKSPIAPIGEHVKDVYTKKLNQLVKLYKKINSGS
jgi:hypothetical protein